MEFHNPLTRIWSRNIMGVLLCLPLLLLFGCSPLGKKSPPLEYEYSNFLFVTAETGATFKSLAADYLNDDRLSSRIKEFNGLDRVVTGQEIIVPLQNFRPGGLTAKGYQLVPVLAYHHFSKLNNSSKKMVVAAKKFDSQLHYLKSNGFYGISLDQFHNYINFGQIPEKSVLITIDDGWESTYSRAYPLIQKYGYSAVLYVPTSAIREKKGRLLSWSQIYEMSQNQIIDIQAHTKSHRNLTKRRPGESFSSYIKAIQSEVGESKRLILNKLGREATSLSYPYGATNSLVNKLVKSEGYTTGFTVRRGSNPFFQNNLNLNRAMIYGGFNKKQFIENLKTFKPYQLEQPEPIDNSLNMVRLDYRNPVKYENQGQWRTALLAWKIHRDWLVYNFKKQKLVNKGNEWTEEYERIKQADNRIITLNDKLKKIANGHFISASATSNEDARRKLLLLTLLYDPKHSLALNNLKQLKEEHDVFKYVIKNGDTFKSIAKFVYRDKGKAALIPFFNTQVKNDNDLTPGSILTLPKFPKRVVARSKGPCGLGNISKPKAELSIDYYTRAVQYFDNGQSSKASSSLKKALCLDPKNHEATEMQELLEDL